MRVEAARVGTALLLVSTMLVGTALVASAAAHKAETCVWPGYSRTGANVLKDVPPGPSDCQSGGYGTKYAYGNWEYDVTVEGNIHIRAFWYAGSPASTGQGSYDSSPGGVNPDWQLKRMIVNGNLLLASYPLWDADALDSANNYGHYVASSSFSPRIFPHYSCAYTENRYLATYLNGEFLSLSRCVRLVNYR